MTEDGVNSPEERRAALVCLCCALGILVCVIARVAWSALCT